MRKYLFFTCSILLFAFQTNAQLTVDAGSDVMVCYPHSDEERIQLAGVASGGVEPYTYTWSGKEIKHLSPDDSVWVYASDLLNDTTIINPSFKSMDTPEDWFTFYLKVEDAAGNVEVDSVKIIDAFIYSGGAYKLPVTIRRGDSIQFFGKPFVFSSNFPLEYSIKPIVGLNDPKDFYGWAKPDTSTTYYIQAVNSAGCVSTFHYWHVEVDTTTVSANSLDGQLAKCYLNQGDLIIRLPQKQSVPYEITIATSNGSNIYRAKHSEQELRLKSLGLTQNQLYIVSIDDGKEKQVFKVMGN
ncbi:MAG TPA: hypothetical protein VFG54_22960 [Prolixibacteraceae bacterium]|nr:hypothetical protein [Prolixibacteraceae bacterium]